MNVSRYRFHLAPLARYCAAMVACLMLVLAACSSDKSPTRPEQKATTPGSTSSNATFSITISSDVAELTVGGEQIATLTINVRRLDTNQQPPNGAVVQVVTTLGSFSDGSQAVSAALTAGRAVVQLLPGDVSGTATVQASMQDSFSQLRLPIVGSTTFFAGAVSPSTGTPSGGETVTLRGQGFVAPVKVEFVVEASVGGASETRFVNTADVISVSPEAVQFVTPPSPVSVGVNETLIVDVRVTNKVGTPEEALQVLEGAFLYALGGSVLQPAVTALSPASGPNEGGTQVRVLGDGFEAPVQVLFGSGSAQSFSGLEAVIKSVSRNEMVVQTPAALGVGLDLRNSNVDVLVRNQSSGFTTVAPSAFRYGFLDGIAITSWAPGNAEYNVPGTIVTIFGSGFDEPVAVNLAGFAMPVVSVTGSEVVVRTVEITPNGCADTTGPVAVTNIETGDSASTGQFIFRVFEPIISSVSPASSPGPGGITASILGSEFEEPVRVTFDQGTGGSVPAVVQSVTNNEIRITIPAFQGDFNSEDCDENGDGTNGTRLLPTPVDIMVESVLTGCTDMLQQAFTYVPEDTTCQETLAAPEADFDFFAISGGAGFRFQFVSTSTGAVTWEWDFDNNGTVDSTQPDPQHDFPGAGSYPVKLRVTNGAGLSDEIIKQVDVADLPAPPPPPPPPPAPEANFTFFVLSQGAGTTVQFTNSSTNATIFRWDFTNDGTFDSTAENPQFDFGASGTYATRLRVTGTDGFTTDEIVKQVTVP